MPVIEKIDLFETVEESFRILEETKIGITEATMKNSSNLLQLVLPLSLGLSLFCLLIAVIICQKYKKSVESQPPEYEPNYPQISPPDYETAITPDAPPPYTYENISFENDPPAYNTVVVSTTRTVIYQ